MGNNVTSKKEEGKRDVNEMMRETEEKFWVSKDGLMTIADDMEAMMRKGLEDETSCFIKMLVTYVDTLPTGREEGCFYALDLGGTNLRVMQVRLYGDKKIDLKSEPFVVPHEMKIGKLNELFDYMAEKVSSVVETEDSDFGLPTGHKRELGFTFSFPVHQERINHGALVNWTKDFDIKEAIGKDVVEELAKALQKRHIDMKVTAVLNDTVGTLAGGRFYDKNVVAAVILGTGMNAAYVEQTEDILKPYGTPPQSGQMVINTEWGNFRSPNLPLTEYDCALDLDSPNQGKQILEKMLSGRYLGEIVRRVLLKLAEEAEFFGDTVPPKLKGRSVLGTDIVSAMHSDTSADLEVVGKSMQEVLEISDVPFEKRKLIVKICEIVSTRAARLSAGSILSILKRLKRDTIKDGETIVAVDGALYAKYKHFRSCVEKTLMEELLEKEVSKTVILRQYKDASGIGAALVAASHSSYGPGS